jgi:hypothetical protein
MTETLTEMVERIFGECKGCGAVGTLFYGYCGMCDAIRQHQHHEIARASEGD